MTLEAARRWLGIYFLVFTGIMGAYILIFGETPLLPIAKSEAQDTFQIIVPVFLGQITIIFQWIGSNLEKADEKIAVPAWVVKLPPSIAVLVVGAACLSLIMANVSSPASSTWKMSPEVFKNAVTFAVSILNASTVFLVAKVFPQKAATSG